MSTPAVNKADRIRVAPPPDRLNSLFGNGTSTYGVDRRSFILSFSFNTLVTVIVIYSSWYVGTHTEQIKKQIQTAVIDISPYVLPESKKDSGGGGGGGDRDKLAASKGALPKQSREQFPPPMVIRRNENPKLEVVPTVVAPPIQMA